MLKDINGFDRFFNIGLVLGAGCGAGFDTGLTLTTGLAFGSLGPAVPPNLIFDNPTKSIFGILGIGFIVEFPNPFTGMGLNPLNAPAVEAPGTPIGVLNLIFGNPSKLF